MMEFVKRDPVLQNDLQVFHTLFSNRELALNKFKLQAPAPPAR
jgi:hypothetical protein